jgi:hypothetical protein
MTLMKENPLNPISKIDRDPNGQLRPGSVLNPNGRPPGSGGGIQRTIESLFSFMNEPAVQARIRDALRKEAEEHPFKYARAVLVPLAPAKQRKALREQIRAAEQAAFDKAQSPFFNGLKTQ